MSTSGIIYVHSSPSAVCPHVEWAVAGVLQTKVELLWTAQAAAPGQLRAECEWSGKPGTAAALVGALRAWPMLRFEVTEEPSPGLDGERFCFVPGLGLWRSRTSANGDIVIGEDQPGSDSCCAIGGRLPGWVASTRSAAQSEKARRPDGRSQARPPSYWSRTWR